MKEATPFEVETKVFVPTKQGDGFTVLGFRDQTEPHFITFADISELSRMNHQKVLRWVSHKVAPESFFFLLQRKKSVALGAAR